MVLSKKISRKHQNVVCHYVLVLFCIKNFRKNIKLIYEGGDSDAVVRSNIWERKNKTLRKNLRGEGEKYEK